MPAMSKRAPAEDAAALAAKRPRGPDKPAASQFRYATICSSNMNRSMEAHYFLQKTGFHVRSFGTGTTVRLPGPTPETPNVYPFATVTYKEMYDQLASQNEQLYSDNGVLDMLERNLNLKAHPERFQELSSLPFDVVITCEEKVQMREGEGEKGKERERADLAGVAYMHTRVCACVRACVCAFVRDWL